MGFVDKEINTITTLILSYREKEHSVALVRIQSFYKEKTSHTEYINL